MMGKDLLTNREVKNKVTGVDIYVSDYQEVPHRTRNEYLYHVIVVSNLFYYKSRELRESDVVQFMVSKTFAEFEDLYKRLYKRFPSVNFPSLPGKSLLSRNINGNLECMDKVLKMVASTQKLSSSPMVISFLRGDTVTNVKYEEDEEQVPEVHVESSEQPPVAPCEPCDENDGIFHDIDLFEPKEKQIVEDIISTENIEDVSSAKSIFDEDCSNPDNDADLFITANTETNTYTKGYDLDADINILELSDEMDELLNLSKTSERQLAIKVHKTQPVKQRLNQSKIIGNLLEDEDMFKKSKHKSFWRDENHSSIDDIFGPKKSSFFDLDDEDDLFRTSKTKVKVEHMNHQDIMGYITEHKDNTEQKYNSHSTEHNNVTVVEPSEPTPTGPADIPDKEHVDSRILTEQAATYVGEQTSTYNREQTDNCLTEQTESSVAEPVDHPVEEVEIHVEEPATHFVEESVDHPVEEEAIHVEEPATHFVEEPAEHFVEEPIDNPVEEAADDHVMGREDSSDTEQTNLSLMEQTATYATEQMCDSEETDSSVTESSVTEQMDSYVTTEHDDSTSGTEQDFVSAEEYNCPVPEKNDINIKTEDSYATTEQNDSSITTEPNDSFITTEHVSSEDLNL